jgi:hypothetical protein
VTCEQEISTYSECPGGASSDDSSTLGTGRQAVEHEL